MPFTHCLSTNNYGPAKFVVSANPSLGTHISIASAIADATSGDTIFIRDGTYTENLTLKPNVNLVAWTADAYTPNVLIIGKMTYTQAGEVSVANIWMQTNSDYFLEVTGSAASQVNLVNCYLDASNNTGIHLTSTGGIVKITECDGDTGTTGIGFFTCTAGDIRYYHCNFTNSGGSTTASTLDSTSNNVGMNGYFTEFAGTIATTGSNACNMVIRNSILNFGFLCISHEATTGSSSIENCFLNSATASAITVGAGATLGLYKNVVRSSNTNAITGAGTVDYSDITFSLTSSVINTTTQTQKYTQLGQYKAAGQPCFAAYSANAVSNVTGDGTAYPVIFDTEIFDLNSNFDGTSTFTAPVTGKYLFTYSVLIQGTNTSHQPSTQLVISGTSAQTFTFGNFVLATTGNFLMTGSIIVPMTATDTAVIKAVVSNSTKTVGVYGSAGDARTTFSGHLVA